MKGHVSEPKRWSRSSPAPRPCLRVLGSDLVLASGEFLVPSAVGQ